MSTTEGPEALAPGPEALPEPPITVTAVTMDPDGDLILRVGSAAEITDFKVCSTTLRRNSPVFKAMLYGSWAESKPPQESESQHWLVSLPEDEQLGMQIILDIIHGNFDKVPVTPSALDLYHAVVTADKYDMFSCLRPWATEWRNEAIRKLNGGASKTHLVHVMWELGDEISYATGLRDLALHACLVPEHPDWRNTSPEDVTGRTLWFRGTKKPDEQAFAPLLPSSRCGPPDIADMITEHRLKDMQELLDFYHAQVNQRTALPGNRPARPAHSPDGDLCDASVLGHIWRELIRNGREGSIPKQAEKIPEESVDSLLFILSPLFKISRYDWLGYYHDKCSPRVAFEKLGNRLRSTSEWRKRLSRDHKERMAKRRQILGLELGDSNDPGKCT